ncbi:hypothetical protein ACEN2T_17920 [Pseudomonas sp. W22_MBD1_FP4]|uniref:hypothetical protein n=1 Tax=Pseudomonas sp. W22_MBD1_FP4 TaxID=3240272 RepID=UPI003F9781AD
MKHKQALADYRALREIAGGEPEDAGELLEQIAEKMLARPTPENAAYLLCELVDLYYQRGNAEGRSMRKDPAAHAIFVRHQLVAADEEESSN